MKYNNIFLWLLTALLIVSCSTGKSVKEASSENATTLFFPDEVKPATHIDCFLGAYYRKVVSSKDLWLGVGGTVTLPQITFDQTRKNAKKPGQYLDNPSVYLGGNMGEQETDLGLAWEVIREADGTLSKERKAFRPFMRRSEHVPSGQLPNYSQAPPENKYYWYPGETVTISLQVIEDQKVKMIVEGAGKRFETDYDCAGYKVGILGEFKRVNAIDQVANEGKPIQPTTTKVENSKWNETYFYRMYKGKVVKALVHEGRYTDMRCPDVQHVKVTANDAEKKIGGETITISGTGY